MTIREKKQSIRHDILKKRAAIPSESISNIERETCPKIIRFLDAITENIKKDKISFEQSSTNDLLNHAQAIHRCTIMSYMSYKNEFPTHNLNAEILRAGYRLMLPYTDYNFSIIPYAVDSLDKLSKSSIGIYEPDISQCKAGKLSDIDIILMPGIAFDKSGNRIGFGKGCYDRFIAPAFVSSNTKAFNMHRPMLIALAYEFQVFESLPFEQNDIPCDAIITEHEIKRMPVQL